MTAAGPPERWREGGPSRRLDAARYLSESFRVFPSLSASFRVFPSPHNFSAVAAGAARRRASRRCERAGPFLFMFDRKGLCLTANLCAAPEMFMLYVYALTCPVKHKRNVLACLTGKVLSRAGILALVPLRGNRFRAGPEGVCVCVCCMYLYVRSLRKSLRAHRSAICADGGVVFA